MYKRVTIIILFLILVFPAHTLGSEYLFPWPGILPDNPLYKVKVLRNKIIYKMLHSPVKRVEFDLLMADKTLYASKLLFDNGKTVLAKETALKGENYMSTLVSDYGTVLNKKIIIPYEMKQNITRAFVAHQALIAYLIEKSNNDDAVTYQQIDYFSKTNYQALLKLQEERHP